MKQPEIRFNGFNDEWVERKLGDFIKISKEHEVKKVDLHAEKIGYYVLAMRTFDVEGYIDYSKPYWLNNFESSDDDLFLNRKEFAIIDADMDASVPKIGKVLLNATNDKFLLSAHIRKIQVDTQVDSIFAYALMRTTGLVERFKSEANGSISKRILDKDVYKQKVYLPLQLEEQQQIGEFFWTLEKIIALHQRKLDLLKEQKKGMLQQMFDDGHKPQVRFSGFNDEWVEKKLGDIGYSKSGVGFPVSEQGGSTGHPFYKVSDMNINGNDIKLVSSNNYVSDNQIRLKNWKLINTVPAIVFAKVGAALLLNRKRIVEHPFLIDNNLMAYIFDKSWDIYFGKTWFDIVDLPKYAQTGALPSYNSSDIERIHVLRPSFPEQQKIGQLFKRLDDRILNEQSKIEQLKAQKQGLLQRML